MKNELGSSISIMQDKDSEFVLQLRTNFHFIIHHQHNTTFQQLLHNTHAILFRCLLLPLKLQVEYQRHTSRQCQDFSLNSVRSKSNLRCDYGVYQKGDFVECIFVLGMNALSSSQDKVGLQKMQSSLSNVQHSRYLKY